MKYFLLLMSSFFLVAPITTFASTSTKELRIVDHQVYLFENGIQWKKLTTRGNVDIINGLFQGYEDIWEKCEKDYALNPRACDIIGYEILFQDSNIALVHKIYHPSEADGALHTLFILNTQKMSLEDITKKVRIIQDVNSDFSSDSTWNIYHEKTYTTVNENYGEYLSKFQKRKLTRYGYVFYKEESEGYVTYRKLINIEQLKKLIK